ncbi:ABC transporter permease subunit [Sporosalibacterium faouarense]|uniref:ABC transporter permease subunit n=1 Tax=Sporosalibacterium faouarense TaxID=516123 RepID=UPI00141CFBA6|nr:ABC transporter permease [Sporosalibacterium faouarense]MTI49095.1 ABC transporter permease [Bacillota bacterium]
MDRSIRELMNHLGLPRIIIILFFISICIMAVFLGLPTDMLTNQVLVRIGMNGVLVLAMVPAILSGTGPNFGLPLGVICGLLGTLISIEMNLTGFPGFFAAIIISIPFAVIVGWVYGLLLNKVKGSEMMIATYTGFSVVFLMSIGWIIMPFKSPEMVWPIGKGLRVTISLGERFAEVLNKLWHIDAIIPGFGELKIPTGLLVFFFILCTIVWLFLRSKSGLALKTAGDNPKFAIASGINVDNNRIIGTVLSTVLGAIGIIVYTQSYGFIQLYQAPLMVAFPAVAAILIGGASAQKAHVSHVILGVFLFQGLLTIALPVASSIMSEGNISEALRMIVQNGIILYALTKVIGGE